MRSFLRENVADANELSWCGKDFRGEIKDTGDFWLEEKRHRKGNAPGIKGKILPTEEGCLVTVELDMGVWYSVFVFISVAGGIVLLMRISEPSGVAFRIFLIISLVVAFLASLFLGIPLQLDETEQKLRRLME
jgi:hypothetical protein